MARRPYRVVFWPSNSPDSRPGTIVQPTREAAQIEAQGIARDGGTAEVRYVTEDGGYQILATYRPTPPKRPRVAGRAKVAGAVTRVIARFRRRPMK